MCIRDRAKGEDQAEIDLAHGERLAVNGQNLRTSGVSGAVLDTCSRSRQGRGLQPLSTSHGRDRQGLIADQRS